jgi:hypothetical protein
MSVNPITTPTPTMSNLPVYNPYKDETQSMPPTGSNPVYPDMSQPPASNNITPDTQPVGPAFSLPDNVAGIGAAGVQDDTVSFSSHGTIDDLEARLAALKKF